MTPANNEGVQPSVAVLPDLEQKRAKAEWPFDVGLVPLSMLLIDDTYQRPPHHEFVAREAARFDPTLVGTIDVAHRSGKGVDRDKNRAARGAYAILDGQQRYLMMQMIGKTACFCSIYTGMSIQDEAGFFYKKNKDRNAMKPYYSFRARKVAGDEEALDIERIVGEEKFTLGPTSNEEDVIGAINSIEQVYGMGSEHREQCLSDTLFTIREAFKGRKDCFNSTIILGLGRFWQTYADDEIQIDKLVQALQEIGPTGLLGLARDSMAIAPKGRSGTQSLPKFIAKHTADQHNKALGRLTGKGSMKLRLDIRKIGLG
jgi:hypothetical protein